VLENVYNIEGDIEVEGEIGRCYIVKKKPENYKDNERVRMVEGKYILTLRGPKARFRPFLKFGQAIEKAIFIKNS
jgi:hypothetical protein